MLTKRLNLIYISAAVIAAVIATSVSAHQQTPHSVRYAKFKGAWFTIEYPAGWKTDPPSRRSIGGAGPDDAHFTSSDGSVEFYVFAPLWNGDPKKVEMDPRRELLVSHRVKSAPIIKPPDGGYISNPVANWYTVCARDGSYERSWVDVEDKGLNVCHVFGIKYRNRQVYQKYQANYAHFCQSLEQFSD